MDLLDIGPSRSRPEANPRDLVLGDCLADFMAQLDVEQTGGRKGTIRPWRRQLTSLFATAFTLHYSGDGFTQLAGVHVADEALILWDPTSPNQRQLWQSTVCLSERFYQAVVDRPFPVSMAALRWLRKSPLAGDLACRDLNFGGSPNR